jgi:hypothetical protein
MIQFDNETRQFTFADKFVKAVDKTGHVLKRAGQATAVAGRKGIAHAKNANSGTWGRVGGAANVIKNQVERKKLKEQYLKEGKSPEEADRLAKKNTSGIIGSYIKGNLTSRAIKIAGDATGITKANGRDKLIVARHNLRNAKAEHASRLLESKTNARVKNINAQIKKLK